ncbi:hypothetical protein CCP2SC5_280032 [Azospirillaceae bacterium]
MFDTFGRAHERAPPQSRRDTVENDSVIQSARRYQSQEKEVLSPEEAFRQNKQGIFTVRFNGSNYEVYRDWVTKRLKLVTPQGRREYLW